MSKHLSKKNITHLEIKGINQIRDISDEVRDIYSKLRMGSPKGDVISEQDRQEIEHAIAEASRCKGRRKKSDEKFRAMIDSCFARAPVASPPKMTYTISNQYSSSVYSAYRQRKISDEVIRARMQDYYLKHGVIPHGITQNEVIPPKTRVIPVIPEQDKGVKKLLESIVKEPFLGIAERYNKIGLSGRKGNECKQKLIELGLITEVSIETSKGRCKLLELTDKGKEELKELGINISTVSTSSRHGGIEHHYWLKQVKQKIIDAGYDVKEEFPIGNGKSVDLVVVGRNGELSEKKIAVEIETGKSDAIGNIRKCLKAGFDGVVSMATNKKALKNIKSKLAQLSESEIKKVRVGGVWQIPKTAGL